MELKDEIVVNAAIEDVWQAFNDPERVAPCLPGAQLTEIEGDELRGLVKVKVGPIKTNFKGAATFIEQNKDDWRIVIDGKGRDARSGNANALITAQLEELSATQTKLTVVTDLKLTGKIASFGGRSGVMEDVSGKLMQQFAANFEEMMAADVSAPVGDPAVEEPVSAEPPTGETAAAFGSAAKPTIRKFDMPEPEAVDLLDAAAAPVVKRVAPVLIGLLLIWLLRRIFGEND
ncbi:MAG: CoxG family protein [Acidimicrobiales bacterium]|jgi:uncharacterized protein